MKLTAPDMMKNKLIDGIIPEPLGGAHRDKTWMSNKVKEVILAQLKELDKLSPQKRIDQRIDKFCAMGVYQ